MAEHRPSSRQISGPGGPGHPGSPMQRPSAEPVIPLPTRDEAPIPLAEPQAEPDVTRGRGQAERNAQTSQQCPSCQQPLAAEAVICINCGFNRREAQARAADKAKRTAKARAEAKAQFARDEPQCPTCGYSLTGLQAAVCPECGERELGTGRQRSRRRNTAKAERVLWITPSILIFISTIVCFAHIGALSGTPGGNALAVGWAILNGFALLGGFFAYGTIAATLTGWTYSIGNCLFRISAILLTMMAILVLLRVPYLMVNAGLAWVIVAVLLIAMLELDIQDAGISAAVVMLGWAGGFGIGIVLLRML